MEEVQKLVEDFFLAPQTPATTHEEWLLRLCSTLMDREAGAVSVAETAAQDVLYFNDRRDKAIRDHTVRRPRRWRARNQVHNEDV